MTYAPKDISARYARIAELVQEMPLSDQTLHVLEGQAMLIERIIATSPSDQAALALWMARGMG